MTHTFAIRGQPSLADRKLLTGGEAVAHAMRQIGPDVVPIYPITPQTPIIEAFARFVADGQVASVLMDVESEHSAMSAAVAASLAGARVMTATASQGLALMIEVVYIASSMRAPIVMAVGNRALSGPTNIHCDHSDSMLARDCGAVQLFVQDAQEAYDVMVIAVRLAEHADVRLPMLVALDGFTITHSAEPVALLADDAVRSFVGVYESPLSLLDVRRPSTQGTLAMPNVFFEFRRQQVAAMDAALQAWPAIAAEFATISGRLYDLIEPYRLDDADRAIALLGSTAGTVKDVVDAMRAEGERVGLLTLRGVRPLPHESIRAAIGAIPRVAVLDRALSPGGPPPLFADLAATLRGTPVGLESVVYGLGGRDLEPDQIRRLFDEMRTPAAGRLTTRYIGLRE